MAGLPSAGRAVDRVTLAAGRHRAIEAPVDRGARTRSAGARSPSRYRCRCCSASISFTDTGLKEQLASRLEPIVARASAELGRATSTEHVGRLVRSYVAEAIEREIAAWKRDQQ